MSNCILLLYEIRNREIEPLACHEMEGSGALQGIRSFPGVWHSEQLVTFEESQPLPSEGPPCLPSLTATHPGANQTAVPEPVRGSL